MTAQKMNNKNNQIRNQLNEHNLKIYEDALIYVRLSNLSEFETESLLLEILDHILQAQKDGKTAEDIMGSDVKAYCNELIENIPREKTNVLFVDYLRYGFILLGSMFIMETIFQILGLFYSDFGEEKLSLVPYLVAFVLTFFAIITLLYAIKRSVSGSKVWFVVAILLWGADITLFVLLGIWFHDVWTITMNVWISSSITLGSFIMAFILKQISTSLERQNLSP